MAGTTVILHDQEIADTKTIFNFLEAQTEPLMITEIIAGVKIDPKFVRRVIVSIFPDYTEKTLKKSTSCINAYKFLKHPPDDLVRTVFQNSGVERKCTSCFRMVRMAPRSTCCDKCIEIFVPKQKPRIAKCGHYSASRYYSCHTCCTLNEADSFSEDIEPHTLNIHFSRIPKD